jgi:NodT family efflux transporter outer membrane factor (OMF) lipoprotein
MSRSFIAALTTAVVVLAGCATGPKYSLPARPTVQTYTGSGAGTTAATNSGQTVAMGSAPREDWWTLLQSPELDSVVALALQNNLSLEVARANLAKAEEGLNAARGARSIQVDAAASVGRRKYGSSFLGPLAQTFPTFSAYSVGPAVSYDLDLFGATSHRIEAAGASADYEHEQLRAARLRVMGDTISQALHIASVRAQISVVQKVLEADEKTLELVRAARRAGVVSDIDVLQATSQRDEDRTLLPPLYQELDVAKDALAILIGKPPAEWQAPDFALDQFVLPHELSLVVPSELVHARPDIRAAEAQLREASARVGIATADLYPRITLSSGWAEEGLLTGGTASAWSLIGGITAPIFHGGTLSAQRRAAQDEYAAAFARYQLVVLNSFGQVADTLHALDHDAEALETQQQALSSADSALGLTRQGYRVGNADILQILTAQRLYELAELGVVQARTRKFTDTVSLFLASGGGVT